MVNRLGEFTMERPFISCLDSVYDEAVRRKISPKNRPLSLEARSKHKRDADDKTANGISRSKALDTDPRPNQLVFVIIIIVPRSSFQDESNTITIIQRAFALP